MNQQIPIPPQHTAPAGRGTDDIAATFARMGVHPQSHPGPALEAHYAGVQNARPPPMYHNQSALRNVEPTFEQYTITKERTMSNQSRWRFARRVQDRISPSELEKRVDKAYKKGLTGDKCLKLPDLAGNRRLQVITLLKDRNMLDLDRNFVWVVKNVKLEKQEIGKNTDTIAALRVILKRQRQKESNPVRAVRSPNQHFPWREIVELPPLNNQPQNFDPRPQEMRAPGPVYRTAANTETIPGARFHPHAGPQQQPPAPMPPKKAPEGPMYNRQTAMPPRKAPEEPVYIKRGAPKDSRQQLFAEAKKEQQKPFSETQKPKSDKAKGAKPKAPKIFQIPLDDSPSESSFASDDDSGFSVSDPETTDTGFSSDIRPSSKAKRTPSPSPRRRMKSPVHRGRTGRSEPDGPEYVRKHKRSIPSDRSSSVRPGSLYARDDVEIQPAKGSGLPRRDAGHRSGLKRHESINSGRPSYNHQRPIFEQKHSSNYDQHHAFGLPSGRPNVGFEPMERIGDSSRESSHQAHLDKEKEVQSRIKARELAEREKKVEEREIEQAVEDEMRRRKQERELEQAVEDEMRRRKQGRELRRRHSRGSSFSSTKW
ncbi:uncharacterized protein KY384_004875 [Bacidia gigantensis]|uniref:uncharacterized protein n=1 Tax=Bacidia gigantensis TaxID=2732470 RepID=UPI001D044AE0|nr:uncharacterized protein KY384_004875 [Bacidia gigantensis]KAG8530373.1 hypothetical protein KY384_004875 [Bacidia gigantensis]